MRGLGTSGAPLLLDGSCVFFNCASATLGDAFRVGPPPAAPPPPSPPAAWPPEGARSCGYTKRDTTVLSGSVSVLPRPAHAKASVKPLFVYVCVTFLDQIPCFVCRLERPCFTATRTMGVCLAIDVK